MGRGACHGAFGPLHPNTAFAAKVVAMVLLALCLVFHLFLLSSLMSSEGKGPPKNGSDCPDEAQAQGPQAVQSGVLSKTAGRQLRIAIISSYPPRACGIAEFTKDLYLKGLQKRFLLLGVEADVVVSIVVVDEGKPGNRSYGPEVPAVIRKEVASDYVMVAGLLNEEFDVVSLQHEYGLFGGEHGELILLLLERLTIPVIVNLHTVPPNPAVQPRKILQRIAQLSNMVTVMLPSLCGHLANRYATAVRCEFMPHGVPIAEQGQMPDLAGLQIDPGRKIILSPGLLSPNKGIESMLEAMVKVRQSVPEALYVIVGRQHPGIKGMDYVGSLKKQVKQLGLEESVTFVTLYQTKEELIGWILLADVVVTPYNDPTQISSGTLSMTVGLGRIAVSTAFPYAEWVCRASNEMATTAAAPCLTVPFTAAGPAAGFAAALQKLLLDEPLRRSMRDAAFAHGEKAQWPRLAETWVATLRREANTGRRVVGEKPRGGEMADVPAMTSRKGFPGGRLGSKLNLGPLPVADTVPGPEDTCQMEKGKGSFYTTNGVAVLHGEIRKNDYVIMHTLPDRPGLPFGDGVRYGGMFLSYAIMGRENAALRLLPNSWAVACRGSDSVYEMRTFLTDPTDVSNVVGMITMTFVLHGQTSMLTWEATVEAFDMCLENVEVQSALDSMSSLFPAVTFDRFYPKLASQNVPVAKSVSRVEIYNQVRDGPLEWDLFTNGNGNLGLVTVIKNVTSLRYVTSHDPKDGAFHYVVHRYHLPSVCPTRPLHIGESRILLRHVDVDNVESLRHVIEGVQKLVGVDVAGPENRMIVQEALRSLQYYAVLPE